MTHKIEIVGLTRSSHKRPNQGGSVILAHFDCQFGGIALKGCALVRTRQGGLVPWPPNLETDEKWKSVQIIDDSLRHQLMEAARVAYRALGGTDAEWQP